VPPWLAELIAQLHDRDPSRRPAAADVVRTLEQHLDDPSLARVPRRRVPGRTVCLVLAAVLAAGLALASWTERDLVGLFLRGQARLVVHNDDPDARIRLAGRDEELHGRGEEVWQVPAGDHLVLTSRPGQRRQEEPIHLGRGSERAFNVAASERAGGPFVVLRRQGGERACANLHEAIGLARAGDTVEVRGNGPFVLPPVTLARPLVIRAAPGYQPVFRHDGKNRSRPLLLSERALALEGLRLEGIGFASWKEGRFVLVQVRGPLAVAGSRLQIIRDGVCIHQEGPMLEVRRSLLLRGESGNGAIDWTTEPGSTVRIDGCVLAGGHFAIALKLPPGSPRTLHLGHSTLRTGHALLVFRDLNEDVKKAPTVQRLRLAVANCIFATFFSVFQLEQPGGAGKTPLPFADSAAVLPKLVSFDDRGSVYPGGTNLLGFSAGWQPFKEGRTWTTLRDWYAFWSHRAVPESLYGAISFQEPDLHNRLIRDVGGVTPAEFRLPATSPAKGTSTDGRDFGADMDLLGPGEPLARWRRTAEYRDWQRLVDRLMRPKGEGK
jgi:hypothetical protein